MLFSPGLRTAFLAVYCLSGGPLRAASVPEDVPKLSEIEAMAAWAKAEDPPADFVDTLKKWLSLVPDNVPEPPPADTPLPFDKLPAYQFLIATTADSKETPLHLAAEAGSPEAIEQIVQAAAALDQAREAFYKAKKNQPAPNDQKKADRGWSMGVGRWIKQAGTAIRNSWDQRQHPAVMGSLIKGDSSGRNPLMAACGRLVERLGCNRYTEDHLREDRLVQGIQGVLHNGPKENAVKPSPLSKDSRKKRVKAIKALLPGKPEADLVEATEAIMQDNPEAEACENRLKKNLSLQDTKGYPFEVLVRPAAALADKSKCLTDEELLQLFKAGLYPKANVDSEWRLMLQAGFFQSACWLMLRIPLKQAERQPRVRQLADNLFAEKKTVLEVACEQYVRYPEQLDIAVFITQLLKMPEVKQEKNQPANARAAVQVWQALLRPSRAVAGILAGTLHSDDDEIEHKHDEEEEKGAGRSATPPDRIPRWRSRPSSQSTPRSDNSLPPFLEVAEGLLPYLETSPLLKTLVEHANLPADSSPQPQAQLPAVNGLVKCFLDIYMLVSDRQNGTDGQRWEAVQTAWGEQGSQNQNSPVADLCMRRMTHWSTTKSLRGSSQLSNRLENFFPAQKQQLQELLEQQPLSTVLPVQSPRNEENQKWVEEQRRWLLILTCTGLLLIGACLLYRKLTIWYIVRNTKPVAQSGSHRKKTPPRRRAARG